MARLRISFIVSLFGLCFAASVSAQQKPETIPAYRNRLLGVYDLKTGEALEGVLIQDMLNKTSALTTRTGTVGLFFLPDGGAFVGITKIGYAPQSIPVAISPSDTEPITVLLERATTLETVVTKADPPRAYRSPALRGFEERRQSGFGRFIPEQQIRKDENRDMSTVLRGLVGITTFIFKDSEFVTSSRSVADGDGFAMLGRSKGTAERCRSTIFIDGVNVGALPINKGMPKLTELAGIEWYASNAAIPQQFNAPNNSCGVLLLWTRER